MKLKASIRLLFPLVIILLGMTACTPDPNEEFIQGRWVYANEYKIDRQGAAHLLNEWIFEGGTFFNKVAVGVPQTLYGNYRILESGEGFLRLEIYNLNGTRSYAYTDQKGEVDLKLDYENDQLRIQGDLFYRDQP